MSSTQFNLYSSYYDLLYRAKNYAAEATFLLELMRAEAPTAKRLLDLGCGTGVHDRHLAAAGYTVHGVDLSETMLARARSLAAADPVLAPKLSYSQGDVRDFAIAGPPFDVVVSLFDVMSYVTENAGFHSALQAVRRHLAPGGVFLFDCWYGPAVYAQQPHVRVRRLEDDHIRITRIAEPVFHHQRNVVDVNYDVFVERKASGDIQRFAETHPMRCYFDAELDELMKSEGFERRFAGQWFTRQAPSPASWSVLFAYQDVRR
jgi:SAM-dependent methyltransferase